VLTGWNVSGIVKGIGSRTYTGLFDVFFSTLQEEGIRGLYKGLTPNLIKVVPAASITYYVYEKLKK
jgi:solute carrier family 25 phosphate transporter 23/24/25/41